MRPNVTTVFGMLVMIVMTANGNPLENKESEIGAKGRGINQIYNLHINYHSNSQKHRVKRALGDCFDESKWSDRYPYQVPVSDNLPSEKDWADKLHPARDQGDICGSCWAFAAVGAIEAQSTQKALSVQCLIDCSNGSCDGGYPDTAFDFVKQNGIATEKEYPYTEKDEECKNYTTVANIKGYYTINTDEELRHAVATVGPVAVGIQTEGRFDEGIEDGIVQECSGEVDHAVLVVGYTTVNNTKVWKIRNSWGVEWGNNGYFYLNREVSNVCMVSSYGAVPIVSVATTATASTPCYHLFLISLGFGALIWKHF